VPSTTATVTTVVIATFGVLYLTVSAASSLPCQIVDQNLWHLPDSFLGSLASPANFGFDVQHFAIVTSSIAF
jgi:hypothetical protein